jgi:hypothetical protein
LLPPATGLDRRTDGLTTSTLRPRPQGLFSGVLAGLRRRTRRLDGQRDAINDRIAAMLGNWSQ